jgi:hypothetical protein
VSAESAKPVERSSDTTAASALMQLEAAVRAARFLRVVQDHGRLVAARAKAGGDKRERR